MSIFLFPGFKEGNRKNSLLYEVLTCFLLLCIVVSDAQGQDVILLNNDNFTTAIFNSRNENKHFRLTEDVDLNGRGWADYYDFSGTLDGEGHAIDHVPARFFYQIKNGDIRNLHFKNVRISSPFNGSPAVVLADHVSGQTRFNEYYHQWRHYGH